ncbi:subtilase family protein [Mobilisporobacter senegalensis]|uniref:Subtilase family protein n=1 Tax=Mobilisporobacter senegalensis TaxID=1329262 RepID=A0A3N1XZZ3_9FIRM|nr:S8 family peptidase [Mobilisporobacter senegalensis]ROR31821.1 subtilase family protein [Mobilisporobacter senegalensis]
MLMNEECRSRIIDNEYVDFIFEYSITTGELEQRFPTECIQPVTSRFAVVYFARNRITRQTIDEFGYGAYPSCFGLNDISNLEASGITRLQALPSFALRGSGILIGIIDTGVQYTNRVFLNPDDTTRIVSIWDQTIDSPNFPRPHYYGTEYTREQINEALASEDPLSIVPSTDENGHGTLLGALAAGSLDAENNFVGVVPDAEFVVVKLKQAKQCLRNFFSIPEEAVCFQETDILQGINYLYNMSRSLNRPIAICMGLGTSQGAHDGRGVLSSTIAALNDEAGVCIVNSAGNEGNSGHHFYGIVNPDVGYDEMELRVGENVNGFSMEIWGYAPNTYSIDILSPTGEYIPRIPARIGESRDINFLFEQTSILINYFLIEQQTGDQLILVRFRNPTAGIWRFRVYARGDVELSFHCWLPITEFLSTETHFVESNPNVTLTSPGNTEIPITATAYNHVTDSIYINASRGFTRDNVIKPDFAAPGVNIYGPTLNNTYGYFSGTSLAAAQTTGVAAMLLEWGILRGNVPNMDGQEVRRYLIRGTRRSLNETYPNNSWGYGIMDIYNTYLALRGETVEG